MPEIIPSTFKTLTDCLEEVQMAHAYVGHGDGYAVHYYTHDLFRDVEVEKVAFFSRKPYRIAKRVLIGRFSAEPATPDQFFTATVRVYTADYIEIELIEEGHLDDLEQAMTEFENETGIKVRIRV